MTTAPNTQKSGRLVDYLLTAAMLACFAAAGWHFAGNPVSQAALSTSPVGSAAESSFSETLVTESKKHESPRYITKNIEDLQAGDLVLAREERGNSVEYKPIKETYRRTSYHLRQLTFKTKDGKQQTIQTTDEHPFWSVTDQAWIDAGDLKPGSKVTSPTGITQTLAATSRTEHPEGISVFNFQVEDFHTYFVAQKAITFPLLVHNADCHPNAEQLANLMRFEKKLPAANTGAHIDNIGDSILATADVPGNVSGSKATYQKLIDSLGNTEQYVKTTFDPSGEIIHIKDKLNGGIIPAF